MGNKRGRKPGPIPDDIRCTAKSRTSGTRCGQTRMIGKTKCYWHGGKSNGKHSITHGLYSKNLKRVESLAQANRLDELISDPKLLDLNRSIALAVDSLERYAQWDLSDEAITKRLRNRGNKNKGKDYEPTPAEMESVRTDLLHSNLKALAIVAGMQGRARSALTQEQLVGALVVPIISNLGRQFIEVVARVVEPEQLERIKDEVALVRTRAVVDISKQLE